MIGIYKITNTLNNKVYIGCSKDIERRWNQHKTGYKRKGKEYGKLLYKAFRRTGIENFTFEILEECDEADLRKRENFWIKAYNSARFGYNELSLWEKRRKKKGRRY